MAQWQTADAKQRFSELVDAASEAGPQVVMRHKDPVAVVLSPDEYRRKWGLPPDYPMVAPAYAERRSAFAKEIGLGRGVRRRGAA